MSRKSYTLKSSDDIKKHTFLRGIRSYLSSASATKTKPVLFTSQRASRIVEKLSPFGKNVALLSFRKSMHSAVVFLNTYNNTYSYVSAYATSVWFLDSVDKNEVINEITDDEWNLRAELTDFDVVYIGGLNVWKMLSYIRERKLINQFDILSNNCSRFAANVLLAGCDIKLPKFQHNRPIWQMPANTKELAKEIDLFLRRK